MGETIIITEVTWYSNESDTCNPNRTLESSTNAIAEEMVWVSLVTY